MHRPHRRSAGILGLSVLMAAGLGACGDDDSTDTATTTTAAGPQGSPVVSIDMADYAFNVSGPLTAGGSLKIANTGAEFHVLAMGKLKPGKTMADLQAALSAAGPPGGEETGPTTTAAGGATTTTTARGSTTTTAAGGRTTTTAAGGRTTTTAAGATTTEPGGAGAEEEDPTAEIIDQVGLPAGFMSPGESVEVSAANLTPGTYALICFVPTEGDGMPHFAKGMVNQLDVVPGTTPPTPTADATYTLTAGEAVDGPATLTPGKHTLRFDAAAGSEELEPALARLNPGTTLAQFDQALNELFESEEPPPANSAGSVPGQIVYAGLDMDDITSFYLTVDLKPGNYYIVAEDTDDDEDPPTPVEMLNVKVG